MVKHIVVDEAQNFRKDEDDKDWYKKAKKISKNGVFWIFLDYFQTSHTEYNSLPQFEDQNPIVCLTVGVRNGSSIHDFIIQKMRNIVSSWFSEREVRMKDHMEELCNNANCAHTFSGKFKTLKKTQSEIIDFVIQTIQKRFSQGHSCKDIAILCCTKKECEKYFSPLLLQLRKKKRR